MEIRINLLPPYRKEEILQSKRIKTVVKLEVLASFVGIIFFVFLMAFAYILRLNLLSVSNDLELKNNQEKYERIKYLDDEFSRANSELSEAIKIKKDQLYWSKLFERLSEKTLDGIEMTDLSTKDYAIFLVGKANSRDVLISFKEGLEKEECFSNVNLPLSNLVSKDNVDFQMDFKIKEECLKK